MRIKHEEKEGKGKPFEDEEGNWTISSPSNC